MKNLFLIPLVLILASCGRDNPRVIDSVQKNLPEISGKIFQVETGKEISNKEFFQEVRNYSYLVLGEKHYTQSIQDAQAKIIEGVVNREDLHVNFAVGWEFLNYPDQGKIMNLVHAVKQKQSTWEKFLDETQGIGKGRTYLPILRVIEKEGGELLALNLPRERKKEITTKGLKDADPQLFPPNFELGGKNYRERFDAAMGDGHGFPLDNLFASQCVTDSWMAENLVGSSKQPIRILINGSFHSDYREGVVQQLKRKVDSSKIISIRLVEAGDEEADSKHWKHATYGKLADIIVIVHKHL